MISINLPRQADFKINKLKLYFLMDLYGFSFVARQFGRLAYYL